MIQSLVNVLLVMLAIPSQLESVPLLRPQFLIVSSKPLVPVLLVRTDFICLIILVSQSIHYARPTVPLLANVFLAEIFTI